MRASYEPPTAYSTTTGLRKRKPVYPETLQPKLRMKDLVKLKAKEETYRSSQQHMITDIRQENFQN